MRLEFRWADGTLTDDQVARYRDSIRTADRADRRVAP